MSKKSRYTLQRTMIIYFLLIGFACIMVSVEFLVDFHRGDLKTEIWENIRHYGHDPQHQEEIFAPIDRMRSKAMLMVGIILLVMVIVLTMFIKNITEPLQHMIELSRKVSSGDLGQTIKIQANNELAELGGVINEMASNLQEITLLSRRMCAGGRQFVDEALGKLSERPLDDEQAAQLEAAVKRLGGDLEMLDQVLAYFRFYTVKAGHDV